MAENRITSGMRRARKLAFAQKHPHGRPRKPRRLGPTRYQPRCVVSLGKGLRCWAPLPDGEHIGPCEKHRDELLAALKALAGLG